MAAGILMELNGAVRSVPADRVEYFKAKGAKVTQPTDEQPSISGSASASASPPSSAEEGFDADAAMKGASRWGSLGFDDNAAEAGAMGGAAWSALRDGKPMAGIIGDAYAAGKQGKAERRAEVDAAYERSPKSFVVGAAPAAVLTAGLGAGGQATRAQALLRSAYNGLPARVANAGKQAARLLPVSVLQGMGLSEGDGAEAAEDGLISGGVTAALGVASPLAGTAAGKGAAAVKGALGRAGQNADELRVLTASGATGGSIARPAVLQEANRVPGGVAETARVMRDTGISKGITTTGGIAKRAAALQESSGEAIGRFIDDATDAGGFVDTRMLANRMRAEAAAATSGLTGVSSTARQHAQALEKMADRIDDATQGGVAPVDIVKDMSVALSDDAQQAYRGAATGRPVAGTGKALMDTRRLTESAIDDSMDGLGMSSPAYRGARRTNQVSRIAGEAAETSLGRAGKNNLIGLVDATLATSGPQGAALAVLRKIAGPLSASTRASAAELARDIAANPKLLDGVGPGSERLLAAARQGGPALVAAAQAFLDDDDRRAALSSLEESQ